MFTGIITDVGRVQSVDQSTGDARFVIETGFDMGTVDMGASIACSGCCLTVVDKADGWFAVDVSAESLSKTTLGSWEAGTAVNLERSLKMGDELGGHIVSGHVDGVAQVVQMTQDGDSWRLTFEVPQEFEKYIAPKGSVALDGVSLTINEVHETRFEVNIIPHTWAHTSFQHLETGAHVNFEVDMLARYVARMLDYK